MPIPSVVEVRAEATLVARCVRALYWYTGEGCITARAVEAGRIDLPAGPQSLGGAPR
jgi:hypothetical protein